MAAREKEDPVGGASKHALPDGKEPHRKRHTKSCASSSCRPVVVVVVARCGWGGKPDYVIHVRQAAGPVCDAEPRALPRPRFLLAASRALVLAPTLRRPRSRLPHAEHSLRCCPKPRLGTRRRQFALGSRSRRRLVSGPRRRRAAARPIGRPSLFRTPNPPRVPPAGMMDVLPARPQPALVQWLVDTRPLWPEASQTRQLATVVRPCSVPRFSFLSLSGSATR